ncbi:MAG: hypothetical protein HC831_28270 [Chloroflexia bacterium]|nr:hypothetical protein [Chloroflexia bacterium]
MKTLKYIFLSCIIAFSLISCEENEFLFPQDAAYVTFKTPDNSDDLVMEKSEASTDLVEIGVAVAAHSGPAVTVDFSFSIAGISNPAVEGVDFELVNTSNTLTFANGVGVEYIQIRLLDNTAIDFNKEIKILLSNPSGSVQLGIADVNGNPGTRTEYLLRITDDEDPLAPYKGTWNLSGDGGTFDITAHPTDPNKVLINNYFKYSDYCDPNVAIIADIDHATQTISFASNVPIAIYGDPFGDNKGKTCVVCARNPTTNEWLPDQPIVGQVQTDGSILFSTFHGFTDAGLAGGAWWNEYAHWTRP